MTLKIALSAGHHNSDGGSQTEYAITGPLCEAYAAAFQRLGCDVRVITPDGPDADTLPGDGMFPGGLQDVAHKVVEWAGQGWVADLYLETHTQGVSNPAVRGAFAIYPDSGSDVDKTVRDGLGLAAVKALSAASGIPVFQSGIMSEKATQVGIDGSRLGIFLRTAPVAATTTRLIIEHGAHSNPQDRAILQDPAKQQAIANASARAMVDYLTGGRTVNSGGFLPGEGQGGPKPFNPNPLGKDVGPGVLEVATTDRLTIITNEDFFVPEHKDLGKRSFTYVQVSTGETGQLQAVQQVDANGNPTGPWKRELWKLDKEYD